MTVLILFVFLSATDFFDGYYARKLNISSKFGKIFDPISDKILVVSTLFYLSITDIFILYPTLLIFLREFIVSGMREYSLHYSGKTIDVTFISKIKTSLQFISIIILLSDDLLLQLYNLNFYLFAYILLWAVTLLTLFTGFQYCNIALKK